MRHGLIKRSVDWLSTAASGLVGFRKLASAGALRKARLLNGEVRPLPRQLARLLWEIAENENLRNECLRAKTLYRGGDFLDVGAHEGLYSATLAPFAQTGARLVSIEPDPATYPTLLDNLAALARLFPTALFPALPLAAGDGRNVHKTSPNPWHRSYQSNNAEAGGEGSKTLTIDQIVESLSLAPDFIKVDVEGAEYAVLKGATRTLQKFDCRLMLEIHPLWQPQEVESGSSEHLLETMNYCGEKIEESELVQRWIYTKTRK